MLSERSDSAISIGSASSAGSNGSSGSFRRDEALGLENVPEEIESQEMSAMTPEAATVPPTSTPIQIPSSNSSSSSKLTKALATTSSTSAAAPRTSPTSEPTTKGAAAAVPAAYSPHKPHNTSTTPTHHNTLSESAHNATSAIKAKFKKLHHSPSLVPQGTSNHSPPSLHTPPSTPADVASSPSAALPEQNINISAAAAAAAATKTTAPVAAALPPSSAQLPKRAHTFSIHRRKTIGSHDVAPSAGAQARKQAAVASSAPGNVPFSFGPSATQKLGTASDLKSASNISSYQSSQRPVPQGLQTRRTFSFSKLSSKLRTDGSQSTTVTGDESGVPIKFSLSSRNTSNGSVASANSVMSTTGKEKVSPAEFLPADLQVKNWSLSARYSSSKLAVVSKNSKVLGKGATAIVKIVHANTKQADGTKMLFAAKVYNKCLAGENLKEHYSKLAEEYIIAHRLSHRNIVHIHDLCLDSNNSWCAVMDYCDGGDLFSLVASYKAAHRKMPKEERNCLFKQLLMGVNYIHGQGVAHRDIKPENLLINSKGELKISDFGVSVIFFDVTKGETPKDARLTSGFAGSIPYLPPEVFASKKDPKNNKYDARLVDIWSCACTYINLVIGGGFFSKAVIEDDPAYVRFMRELNRYWQHEKGLNTFLIAEGETNIESEEYDVISKNAAATAKIVQRADELAAEEDEAENTTAEEVSRTSTATSNATDGSDSTTSLSTPAAESEKLRQLTRSEIMNMTEEQQPLFFFNEFGDAGKKLLARMLLPDPALRPQITDIMATSIIRRLNTCVPNDLGPLFTKLPSSTADFKKLRDQNAHLLNHTHKVPSNGPSLLGLGFKDPYKDMYY